MSDEQHPAFEFRKNGAETVRAFIAPYAGHELAHVRVFFKNPKTGDVMPTRKGLALRLECLPELRNAVDALISETGAMHHAPEDES